MKRQILKIEMKKAFFNPWMYVAMGCMCVLVLFHSIHCYLEFQENYKWFLYHQAQSNQMISADSVFCNWLGDEVGSFETSLFFFLFTLISALPFGWSLATERKSGYIKNIMTRCTKKEYFFAKYIATFLSGAFIVMFPLVLSFLILLAILPCIPIESIYPYGTMGQDCMWFWLYYEHPFSYCFLYTLLDGCFGGIYACLSMSVAFFTKEKLVSLLLPFSVTYLMDYINQNFILEQEVSPIRFLQGLPSFAGRSGVFIATFWVVLFVICCVIYEIKGKNYENL